jgi:hypothetical protein
MRPTSVTGNRLAIVVAAFSLVAWQCGCSRKDEEQAKRKLRESGQELKHDVHKAGQELRHDAHEASREIKKEADKLKHDADSK